MNPQFTIAEDLTGHTQFAVPLVVSRCGWLQEAAQQFRAIDKLPENWDGDGASRPNAYKLDAAWKLLVALCSAGNLPKPHLHPTRDSGVQFEWESDVRYFEIEIATDSITTFFFRDDESKTEDQGEILVSQSLDRVLGYVRRVMPSAEDA